MSVGLALVFVHLFFLAFFMFFCFSLDYFVVVLFAFVVLVLVFSVLRQEIGREERLRNDLFCAERDIKRYLSQSTNLTVPVVEQAMLLCLVKRKPTCYHRW